MAVGQQQRRERLTILFQEEVLDYVEEDGSARISVLDSLVLCNEVHGSSALQERSIIGTASAVKSKTGLRAQPGREDVLHVCVQPTDHESVTGREHIQGQFQLYV